MNNRDINPDALVNFSDQELRALMAHFRTVSANEQLSSAISKIALQQSYREQRDSDAQWFQDYDNLYR